MRFIVLRSCLAAGLLLALSAAFASADEQAAGVRGDFSVIQMAHTPDWPTATDVSPWDGRSDGTFTYRGIPCSGNAPVNNISSDLPTYNTRIGGSRSPASTRAHPLQVEVRDGLMHGRISWTVCNLTGGPTTDDMPDAERDRILFEFEATPSRITDEEVTYDGVFRIVGGTGRYANLTGEGTIAGYLFCFDPEGCTANQGRYRDTQFVMRGTYFDPTGTEQPAASQDGAQ